MKVAIAQAEGVPGDVAANLEKVGARAAEAAAAGAGLVVFPETFLGGYNVGEHPPQSSEPIRAIAAEHGIAVLCGYAERADGRLYNSAALAGPDGTLLLEHRKLHLFGDLDRRCFTQGEALQTVELGGLTVGVLICFDIEFPEAARALAARGAQLIAVPTALMAPHAWIPATLVPARAYENQVYVAYANRVGREGDLHYIGSSCLAGPDGRCLRAGTDEEELLVGEVDVDAIARARAGFAYLDERRSDLY